MMDNIFHATDIWCKRIDGEKSNNGDLESGTFGPSYYHPPSCDSTADKKLLN